MRDYSRELSGLSCRIWDYAELKFDERRSAEAIASFLESEGFLVTRGIAGMETAFSASWGEGDPVIDAPFGAQRILPDQNDGGDQKGDRRGQVLGIQERVL